jgi:hypothetical protein
VSGGGRTLRELNEGSAEVGNGFWDLFYEVECTQPGTMFGDDVSIKVTDLLVSEMKNKYSGTCCVSKDKYPSTQKHLYQHPVKQLYPKQTQRVAPWDTEWFYKLRLCFLNNPFKAQKGLILLL